MRLTDLEPQWLTVLDPMLWGMADTIEEADGIEFLCPKCFQANGGRPGTHMGICWRPHVPQTVNPTPGRWEFQGAGYHDLTLVAGSSSVHVMGGCDAHFFIRGGEIVES